jgi:hypothetical protein
MPVLRRMLCRLAAARPDEAPPSTQVSADRNSSQVSARRRRVWRTSWACIDAHYRSNPVRRSYSGINSEVKDLSGQHSNTCLRVEYPRVPRLSFDGAIWLARWLHFQHANYVELVVKPAKMPIA